MSAKSDPVRRARREGRTKLTHGERMASGLPGRPLQRLVRTRAGATPVGANRQESAGRVQFVADEGIATGRPGLMRGMATHGTSSSRRRSCRCKRPICDGRDASPQHHPKRTTIFAPRHQTRQHFGDVDATAAAPAVARTARDWSTRPRPRSLEHFHQVCQVVPPIYVVAGRGGQRLTPVAQLVVEPSSPW